MRKFWLKNEAGGILPLNGENGIYLHDPTNLGYTRKPGFADLGSGYFLLADNSADTQQALGYTLTFTENPYAAYQNFVSWIGSAGRLSLLYAPDGPTQYVRDVTLNSIGKTELEARWLRCPVVFLPLTPWYLPEPAVLELTAEDASSSKTYDYTYDYTYGSDSIGGFTGQFSPTGDLPAAIRLEYVGQLVNPRVQLSGAVSGKSYGICAVAATLDSTETLIVSTLRSNAFVRKRDASGVETDLLDLLDLPLNPFPDIPVSEPCRITISSDAPVDGAAQLQVFSFWRSV